LAEPWALTDGDHAGDLDVVAVADRREVGAAQNVHRIAFGAEAFERVAAHRHLRRAIVLDDLAAIGRSATGGARLSGLNAASRASAAANGGSGAIDKSAICKAEHVREWPVFEGDPRHYRRRRHPRPTGPAARPARRPRPSGRSAGEAVSASGVGS